jgi:tRNA 2-thiouridine synthesizing protein A
MAGSEIIPDQILDCSGLNCPVPVIKTAEAIKRIEIDQILQVISTDRGSPPDMEAWSRQTGHILLNSQEEDGQYIFFFLRTK